MNKKDLLVRFLLKGLRSINEITENIDMTKTTEQYIREQLPEEINNSFLRIKYSEGDEEIDETFFAFLKDNDKFFENMRIINLDGKSETLKEQIGHYFNNMHSKYNEDKLFYFYFQLVMMEIFLADKNIGLPRQELKENLMDVLKNYCFVEKRDFSKCLGDNMEEIDVIAMSDFDGKVEKACKIPKDNLEQCVRRNYTRGKK